MDEIIKGTPNYMEYTLPEDSPDEDLPNYRNLAYDAMAPAWTLVDDVYAGTFRIREKRKDYIPKFPLESDEAYADRCDAAVLMNMYARTVDAMTGLVVGSGLKTEGIPDRMEPHLKNIDNAGTEFEVFARDVLRDAFNGHCVVLIDMPHLPEAERPKNATAARKMNLQPYWTRMRPDQVYNWRTAVIDGKTMISQITLRQDVSVPVGEFGEQTEVRYLRWALRMNEDGTRTAHYTRYVEYDEEYEMNPETNQKGLRKRFKVVSRGATHMKRIPVFVVYGDQPEGRVLESRPPLLDLAHKNVEHLQIDSDYKKGLKIAGIALPVIKTDRSDDELDNHRFAWDQFLIVGKDEDFEFREANGNALPNKKTALDDLKREMGVLGLSLIAERADANITATERLLDSVQQSNQLMAIQASLLQGLRKGLEIHGEWLKISESELKDAEVALGLDWTELVRSADHMQLLFEMAKEDFLSTITLIESAGRYGVLPSYVKAEDEVKKLEDEGRVRQSRYMMKSTTTGVSVSGGGSSPKQKTAKAIGREKEPGETEVLNMNIEK